MIAPNTLLQNRYLVLNQIGQGGMGAVYIATDQRFGSTVALKETFFTEESLRKAFEREARLLNHLRHPALPRVSDHFAEEEGQFLVMEYIAGDDLAEKLKERGSAFPASEVLNWADQLLDALDYLHTQEPAVIHRDIKPQNLKLTPRNAIVLLDFGLAKGAPVLQVSKVTATGSVFGYSRNYAPLEQIQGAGTDPRSDLYSLSATLYHLITGVTPPDALTRATAVLNGQPDPLRPANEVHPQVSPAIAEVLNNAMALNAGQRPQTASAMREALREAARQGHSVSREAGALPSSSPNLYEQETQLIYAAESPATVKGEAENKTGPLKPGGATAVDSQSSSTDASPAATKARDSDSVITKVAAAQATKLKSPQRRRAIGLALSAAVLIALAAGVYTFTRNTTPTPAPAESVQSPPVVVPQTNNTENANGQGPGQTVVVIKKGASETRHTNAPSKPAKDKSLPDPGDEAIGMDNEPPVPPTPNQMADPRARPRRFPRPDDPAFAEAMRLAIEQKRAEEESKRAAREQRRMMIFKQRAILEEEKRRRERIRQQQP